MSSLRTFWIDIKHQEHDHQPNTSAPEHEVARGLLVDLVGSGEIVALPWPVLFAFLRIATHPRIFARPLSFNEAQANVTSLLSLPNVRSIGEGEEFWHVYQSACDGVKPTGNAVPDGVRTLYTHDSDFRRFAFLRVIDPMRRA